MSIPQRNETSFLQVLSKFSNRMRMKSPKWSKVRTVRLQMSTIGENPSFVYVVCRTMQQKMMWHVFSTVWRWKMFRQEFFNVFFLRILGLEIAQNGIHISSSKSVGEAFVAFMNMDTAQRALNSNRMQMANRSIFMMNRKKRRKNVFCFSFF